MPIHFKPIDWPRCRYRIRSAESRESIFSTPGWQAHRHRYWVIDVGPRRSSVRVHGEIRHRNSNSVGLYAPGTLYEEQLEVGQLVSWTWLLVEETGSPSKLRTLTGKQGFALFDDPYQAIRKAIASMVNLSLNPSEGKAFHLNALLHQILGTLFDLHEHRPPVPVKGPAPVHPWRAIVRDWLEGKQSPPDSAELANLLGISLSTLTHRYHQLCGETLGQTISGWRMEKASVLLVRPELSVKEVAMRLGFTHQSHFSAFFREETGFTPTQFRHAESDMTGKHRKPAAMILRHLRKDGEKQR